MTFLASAAGYAATGILVIIALLVILVQNAVNNQTVLNPFLRSVCRLVPASFGISVTVEGLENIDPDRTYIFVANHVNIFDGFILYGYIPHFVRGVELEDHFSWPVWGSVTRKLGNIPISHKDHRSAVRSLEKASEALKRGVSLIMLPEGHRTRNGKLQPFMRGPFRTALAARTDIVPIVMKDAYERKSVNSKLVHPGRVQLVFGKPVSAESFQGSSDKDLRDRVREIILQMLTC